MPVEGSLSKGIHDRTILNYSSIKIFQLTSIFLKNQLFISLGLNSLKDEEQFMSLPQMCFTMKANLKLQQDSTKGNPSRALLLLGISLVSVSSVFAQQQLGQGVSDFNEKPLETITLQPGTINWVSFPRLERQSDGTVDSEFFFESTIPDPSNFFEARHNEGGVIIDKTYSEGDWSGDLDLVRSSLGYKIRTNHNSQAYIPMTGTVLAPNTDVSINPFYENWLGYFLYKSQSPFDAFPDEVQSKLQSMKGKYWSCIKKNMSPTKSNIVQGWLCACNQIGGIWLNYGDMVAVYPEEREEFSFQWQQVPGQKTESTYQPPEYFSFTEGYDYTSLFIEPDSSGTIQEIGAFAGDSCIGAAVVNPGDSIVLVRAFVPPGSQDSITLQLYDGMKSGNRVVRQYYVTTPGQEEPHYRSIKTRERKPWYLISLKDKPDESIEVPIGLSFITYPNPAGDQISLRVTAPEASAPGSLLLLDMQGRIVAMHSTGPLSKGDNLMSFSLKTSGAPLPSGLYQLVLRSALGTATQKLIVQ